ncbi:hypothetical protein [Streptosporangium sp. NPDC023615]|uniref:hypothetical protein n=1 Tax=Streptosporangium sp. NPDC023615 TaxID=3154794 RepID=UPI0034332E3A
MANFYQDAPTFSAVHPSTRPPVHPSTRPPVSPLDRPPIAVRNGDDGVDAFLL